MTRLLPRLLEAPKPSKQCNQLEVRSQDMNCGRYYVIKPSLWSLINVPSHAHLGWNEWVNQKVVKPSFVMLCIKLALKVLLANRCQWLEKKKYMKAKIPSSKYKEAKVKGYKENKREKKEEAWSIFGLILPGCFSQWHEAWLQKPYVSTRRTEQWHWAMIENERWNKTVCIHLLSSANTVDLKWIMPVYVSV